MEDSYPLPVGDQAESMQNQFRKSQDWHAACKRGLPEQVFDAGIRHKASKMAFARARAGLRCKELGRRLVKPLLQEPGCEHSARDPLQQALSIVALAYKDVRVPCGDLKAGINDIGRLIQQEHFLSIDHAIGGDHGQFQLFHLWRVGSG